MDYLPAVVRQRIVVTDDGHWLWGGPLNAGGYGTTHYGRRSPWLVHRLVWHFAGFALPPQLHHRCHVRPCCRPDHMAAKQTAREHADEHIAMRDTCRAGHPWTDDNTWRRRNGQRVCRACKAAAQRRRYARDPAAEIKARADRRRRNRTGGDILAE